MGELPHPPNKGAAVGPVGALCCLQRASNPDGKLEGQSCWTRTSRRTVRTDESQSKMGQTQSRHGRTRRALMWMQLPPTVLHLHSLFTTDIKTTNSNLTAEVEWWHGSSRVSRCMHRILMTVRQRPQAPGQLYKPRPIVLTVAPCWHAITQTMSTFDFCLRLFFFTLLILCLTSLPPFHSSGGSTSPPFNPRAPALEPA